MADNEKIETHPFEPFIPEGSKILMLGTFPPKPERWSMPFYYPNKINDMWRIMGIIFFDDKEHFFDTDGNFNLDDIKHFLADNGIALYDTALRVIRERDNASDKYLNIVEPTDIRGIINLHQSITAIVATGEKAATVAASLLGVETPKTGTYDMAHIDGREIRLYRMPSTSRAYPLALTKKAEVYRNMLVSLGIVK